MLELRGITKDYVSGNETVHALKGVSIRFRQSEFVSILGQSGCGKTTLLNILGGLDRYTSGDLLIGGRSTKGFSGKDWDAYRNHSIGFVFQSYNLIAHQSVLRNVELALTISGVSRRERSRRALEALAQVGLADQAHKRPSQLSGGQMQRVAIARAIVNDPEIILADEPTGALDTATSIQIMDILKHLSERRLVIMVTHNPELADQYSTRIVRLQDGTILSDTMPYVPGAAGEYYAAGGYSTAGGYSSGEDYSAAGAAGVGAAGAGTAGGSGAPARAVGGAHMAPGASPQSKRQLKKAQKEAWKASGKGKRRMSFLTALGLSFNNLRMKMGRTVLTAFAGSIGIIGIALILSLSNGTNLYITSVEEDTLSSYPLTIESSAVDMSAMMLSMTQMTSAVAEGDEEAQGDLDVISCDNVMTGMISRMTSSSTSNDLTAFYAYLHETDEGRRVLDELTNDVEFDYDTTMYVYGTDLNGQTVRVNPSTVLSSLGLKQGKGTTTSSSDATSDAANGIVSSVQSMNPMMSSVDVWKQLPDNDDLLDSQYDVLAGRMPQSYDEVVLIVENDGSVSDYLLYALGFKDQAELGQMVRDAYAGEKVTEPAEQTLSFDEVLGHEFKLVLPASMFQDNGDGTWSDMRADEAFLAQAAQNGETLTVVGVIRPNQNAAIEVKNGAVGFRADLTRHIVQENAEQPIVAQQKANPDVDVFTGIPFDTAEAAPLTMDDVWAFVGTLDEESAAAVQAQIEQAYGAGMGDDQIVAMFSEYIAPQTTDATYEGNLAAMEVSEVSTPSSISISPKSFDDKEEIVSIIDSYNEEMRSSDQVEKVIQYSDYVGLMMSSVRTVIDAISYILIAFVAISLVVSSIMIGIITYISVLERTKEIGILRAIGASKRDVSRVFNAETFVVGLLSGVLGIVVTLLLLIPANIVIENLTGLVGIAQLPWEAAAILVVISVLLTLIGGLIPSKMAARRDPVAALRGE